MNYQTCCVTGNRPQKFPWKYWEGKEHKKYLVEMTRQIDKLIDSGYTYFISGGAIGVDMDFATAVLQAKKQYKDIILEIAVPCKNQDLKWGKADKRRYAEILNRADIVNVLSENYTSFCMQKRNEYMVDKSDLVIAFWNGEESGGTWNTMNYAKHKGKQLLINKLS